MIGHISIRVGDLANASQFYDAVFGALGHCRSYFAAFLLDPDGNNLEAVCTAETA